MASHDGGGRDQRARVGRALLGTRALRAHIINNEPELRGRARASYYPFERVLAEAIGEDLGQIRKTA